MKIIEIEETFVCIKTFYGDSKEFDINVGDKCNVVAKKSDVFFINFKGETTYILNLNELKEHFITLVEFRNKRINEILE